MLSCALLRLVPCIGADLGDLGEGVGGGGFEGPAQAGLGQAPRKTAEPGQSDYLRGNRLAVLVLAGGPAAAPFHQPSAGWSCFLQR